MSSEVHMAFRRWYRRFQARRITSRRMQRRRNSQSSSTGIIMEQPVQIYRLGNINHQQCLPGTRSPSSVTVQSTSFGPVREMHATCLGSVMGNKSYRHYPTACSTVTKSRTGKVLASSEEHVVSMLHREPALQDEILIKKKAKHVECDDVIIPLSELVPRAC